MHVFPFSTTLKFPSNDDLTAGLKFKTTYTATNPLWICAKRHSCPQPSRAPVRLGSLEPPGDEDLTLSCMSSAQSICAQTPDSFFNYSEDGVSLLYW